MNFLIIKKRQSPSLSIWMIWLSLNLLFLVTVSFCPLILCTILGSLSLYSMLVNKRFLIVHVTADKLRHITVLMGA